MKQKVFFALCLFPLLLSAWGCDKASPVAPEGTILTVSASPSQIGLNGTSTITVVGRQANGSPLNPGTEIRFTTDKGTITPVVAPIQNGVATAVLRADTRSGPAKVTASTGTVTADTTIQIGQSTETRPTVLVSVNPNTIDIGDTATVTVIARNADGSPVGAGQEVILTTDLGTISPSRPTTRADGTATATLRSGSRAGTATITAIVGSSEAKTATVTIRDVAATISLQAVPQSVSLTAARTEIDLTAFVLNSQNQPLAGSPVTFLAERGTLERSGIVPTQSDGQATNTLVVTQDDLRGLTAGQTFRVEATTPAAEGQPVLRATVLIRVQ
ncbi:MAG TPA: invasin domain 3-containing protein [Thermoanaerobaculia bacterium]|nr:invasin domain 3-containing protein [Thermoanaerobaculia bacterium]